MKRKLIWLLGLLAGVSFASQGCKLRESGLKFADSDLSHYETVATEIEYPGALDPCDPCDDDIIGARPPRSIGDDPPAEYRPMTLQQAVHLALENSKVFRDLGGTVLRSPETVPTSYAPGVQETDPQFGVEAALSAFDAQLSTSLFFEKNDRRLNNEFLGNGGFFQQDFDVFQTEITKRAVTGSQFTLRKNLDFDNNTSLGNTFESAWNVNLEGEVRHPLLQNGGLMFNRIAGPGARPGMANGVLIARVRADISLADFELGLRDFISNVENAYWDLYFAYRDLDAKVRARNQALETWRKVSALVPGRKGAEDEAQAREQYFRFEADVQNALAGRLLEGSRTNNGSTPGTFRALPGVQLNERKLRLLIGLPLNGEYLIRPSDEPAVAVIEFDWRSVATEAFARRAELRRQRWQVKRREMELTASRNFLLPNLDLVGRYRWRGFGHTLVNSDRTGLPRFDNAYMDLTSGDFQEWLLGAELSVPLGFRRAHAGVRNAELRLSRERVVLREQQRQVVHDLSNAVADTQRAYALYRTNYNRSVAARQQVAAVAAAYEQRPMEIFVLLDAQRRAADAESRYYESMVEYAMAVRNVHFEKGTLLDYCGIILSEGPWPGKAYIDAAKLERQRGRPRPINYALSRAPIISQGTYPQWTLEDPSVNEWSVPHQPMPPAAPRQLPPPPDGNPQSLRPQQLPPRGDAQWTSRPIILPGGEVQ